MYSGANSTLNCGDINKNSIEIESSNVIVSQLEIPFEPIIKAFEIAKNKDAITILNPAPAKFIPDELLKLCDIVIPNEFEAEKITGIFPSNEDKIMNIGSFFYDKGVMVTIITLGEKGAAIYNDDKVTFIKGINVKPVDTTAAGDTFIGAVAWYLSKNKDLSYSNLCSAVSLANKVAAISVTKEGAQSSIPYLSEVIEKYGGIDI